MLQDAKKLGKDFNSQQVDASLIEMAAMYWGLWFSTLFEQLKVLAATEQK